MRKVYLTVLILIVLLCFLSCLYFISSQRQEIAIREDRIYKLQEEIYDLKDKLRDFEIKNQEPKLDRIEIKAQECMKQNNYTTAAMAQCTYDSEEDWQNEISKYIIRSKNVLTPEAYSLLLESQKYWKMYRKTQAQLFFATIQTKMGTMYIPITASEIVAITKERAKTLKFIYDEMLIEQKPQDFTSNN